MTTALVARRSARLARRAESLPTSPTLFAFFTLEKTDVSRGIATYVLRVGNRTDAPVLCRTWILAHGGEALPAYPHPIEIAPQSEHTLSLPIRMRDFPAFQRTVAELVGSNVRCVVEAPAPVTRKARRLWPISAACLAAAAAIGGAMMGLQATQPRITALTLPAQTQSGATVEAHYATRGIGSLSYVVAGTDGRTLQGGSLHGGSGTIAVNIPPANASSTYTIRVLMTNPLGSATETRSIEAEAIAPHAWVASVAVEPAVVRTGDALRVTYSAAGEAGYVRLISADGTIWGERPFSHDGEASFIVPPGATGAMRVVVRANAGTSSARSMAGVFVANRSAATGSPVWFATDINGTPIPDDGTNKTFALVKSTVRSGEPISVRVLTPHADMRISLTDMQSHEIGGVPAGDRDAIVTIAAPVVAAPTRYTVVATFSDAFGQETVVEPLTVVPASTP